MQKQSTPLLILFLFFSAISNAQLENYKLSDYKLPEFTRQSLELEFIISDDYSNERTDFDSTLTHKFNFDPSFEYKRFTNSERNQKEIELSGNLGGHVNDDETSERTDDGRSVGMSALVDYRNRRYSQQKFFWEPDLIFRGRCSRGKEKDGYSKSDVQEYKSVSVGITIKPGISIGKGRLEEVQYARQAIYMLEGLTKQGIIKQSVTTNTIISLADQLARLENKRFFDYRLHRINAFKQIDSLLFSHSLLDSTNAIEYFTTLLDFWDYGSPYIRKSGSVFRIFINPEYTYSSYVGKNPKYDSNEVDDVIKREYNNELIAMETGIEYQYHKPIDYKWQYYLIANGRYSFSHKDDNEKYVRVKGEDSDDRLIEYKRFNIYLVQAISYYPNTRTSIGLRHNVSYFIDDQNDKSNTREWDYDEGQFNTKLSGYLNYYFSPRVRLEANLSLEYRNEDNDNTRTTFYSYSEPDVEIAQWGLNRFSSSFEVALKYAIF